MGNIKAGMRLHVLAQRRTLLLWRPPMTARQTEEPTGRFPGHVRTSASSNGGGGGGGGGWAAMDEQFTITTRMLAPLLGALWIYLPQGL